MKTAKLYGVLFPPVLIVVIDDTFSFAALILFEERYLVTNSKFHIFGNVKMSLTGSLQVEVIPYTGLHTETDVVEGFVVTGTIILVEQGTLSVTINGVVAIIVVARWIVEVYTPVGNGGHTTKLKLVVPRKTP